MNSIIITGRLVKDASLNFLPGSGTAVLKLTLACDREYKKKLDEEGKQSTDFIPVTIFGKMAEATANYCGLKGNSLMVRGALHLSNYTDKEGNKKYVTEVLAEKVEFLNTGGSKNSGGSTPYGGFNDDIGDYVEGDVPF